jgi:hypothetical protein
VRLVMGEGGIPALKPQAATSVKMSRDHLIGSPHQLSGGRHNSRLVVRADFATVRPPTSKDFVWLHVASGCSVPIYESREAGSLLPK